MKKDPLPSGESMTGHGIAFDIMRLCGVDPAAAVRRTAAWPEGYGVDYVENDRAKLRMRTALDASRNVLVEVNGSEARISVRGQTFPDSVMLSASRLSLRQVVDHVLLTGSRHRIDSAVAFDPAEEGVGTHFVLAEDSIVFTAP